MTCKECHAEEGDECICDSLCAKCGGTGVLSEPTVDSDGDPDWLETQCYRCGGDGQARPTEPRGGGA